MKTVYMVRASLILYRKIIIVFNDIVYIIRFNKVCNSMQKLCKTSIGGILYRVIQVLVIKGA